MKLAIITIVQHSYKDKTYYGYAPYVREMNLWGKYVDELLVLGPRKISNTVDAIDTFYQHRQLRFFWRSQFQYFKHLASPPYTICNPFHLYQMLFSDV